MIVWLVACRPARPDVVLVTLDTTRADHVGAYGGPTTPALDRLAADGRRYARAYSPVPLTVPAHASLLTGRYPPRLGVRGNGDAALPPAATTLAEHLRANGWTTGGFVGAVVTSRAFGFDQGFDAFGDAFPGEERPADAVVDEALAWAASTAERPRFLWVHLYDPHLPNRPDAAHPDPYDAAIGACDAAVGRLRAAFDRRPTWFVVAGDHGESRGDHGEVAHGRYVYPATQHVPWLLAGPGVHPGEVVADPVSLVDVAPTLVAALGLPAMPGADGTAAGGTRPLYLESWQLAQRYGVAPHVGVVDGDWLLVDVPRPELYDLAADPLASRDLSADHPDAVERLRAALRGFGFGPPEPPATALDPELVRRLADLGYVAPAEPPTGPLPDPKDRVGLVTRAEQAELLSLEGRFADAEPILAELIAESPELAELHARRAWALLGMRRTDDAVAELRTALALRPGDPQLQVGLGARLAAEGRFDEAADLFRAASEAMPGAAQARAMAVRALLDAGRPADAADLAVAWREQHPDEAGLAGLLGIARTRMGRMAEALPLLEEGAAAARPEAGVRFTLAASLAGQGQRDRAIALLDAELADRPTAADALLARCAYHRKAGEVAEMQAIADQARAVDPGDAAALACAAAADLDLGDRDSARLLVARSLAREPGSTFARAVATEIGP